MQFEPTMILRRLAIYRADKAVYDEVFHEGVNVIRGENSSGKSTILNAIFYGLGGDLADWSEVALLCTHIMLEVEFNGRVATLRRDISQDAGQPMMIVGGSLDAALAAPIEEWRKYPYRRSASMESFSQALFRLLGWPEVKSDDGGNLTMHQVMRLLYADQLSPTESLFRFERFDPPSLRDAIGRLLCGAYDARIYEGELEVRALTKDFDAVAAELKSLSAVIGKTGSDLGFGWIMERRGLLDAELLQITAQIEAGERRLFESKSADELTLQAQRDAYSTVQALQQEIATLVRERDALNFAIGDSGSFIANLKSKVGALEDATLVADTIGGVKFSSCPACYAPVEDNDSAEVATCHLCKAPFDTELSRSRLVSMVSEAGVQLKQSLQLQAHRAEKLQSVNSKLEISREAWVRASRLLAEMQRLPSTEAQDELRELNRRAGYLEREIENLAGQERIVQLISELSAEKNELNSRISRVKTSIEEGRILQRQRFEGAYDKIAKQIIDLLRHDLRRQDSFENPNSVEFDFSANRISVDGKTYFSASSRVILKSSFFLGFLAAATQNSAFNHPRFVIIDTVEDKGMEVERSHNFQNQILRKSREAISKHQIIYGTAMISPDLDDEQYTVGKFSTRDDPTLEIEIF